MLKLIAYILVLLLNIENMPVLKVLTSYRRFGHPKLRTFATNILKAGVYAHPTEFAKPPVTEAEYTTVLTYYGKSIDDYNSIGSSKKTEAGIEKKKVIAVLDQLQKYVQGTAGLTPELIDLSGFERSKTEQTKGVAPNQTNVEKVEAAGNGAMKLTLAVDKAAYGYSVIGYEVSDKEPNILQSGESILVQGGTSPAMVFGTSSNHTIVLSNLVIGKKYNIHVFTFNPQGTSPLSKAYLLVSHNS